MVPDSYMRNTAANATADITNSAAATAINSSKQFPFLFVCTPVSLLAYILRPGRTPLFCSGHGICSTDYVAGSQYFLYLLGDIFWKIG